MCGEGEKQLKVIHDTYSGSVRHECVHRVRLDLVQHDVWESVTGAKVKRVLFVFVSELNSK